MWLNSRKDRVAARRVVSLIMTVYCKVVGRGGGVGLAFPPLDPPLCGPEVHISFTVFKQAELLKMSFAVLLFTGLFMPGFLP